METLRIIEHGNGHTDIEALIFSEWVVVKCIENTGETTMQYRLTATNEHKRLTVSEIYFTSKAAEIARTIYEARGYTVTITQE